MWALDNRTPFAADRTWVRDVEGEHQWIVAVKATYAVGEDGSLELADEQPAPLHAAEHYGSPATTSVRLPADLTLPKPGTDVLLNATAHAPSGEPATEVPVTMRIAGRTKTLIVHGERNYTRSASLQTSAAAPFLSCPIRYELAYGGQDLREPDASRRRIEPRNPVGRGVSSSSLRGQPAHRIEYPGEHPAKAPPAGFAAIASHWSPRRGLAGTYDERWTQTKRPLLPDDFDPASLLASPQDQRPDAGRLHGGEPIQLLNMTPSGWLALVLPRHTLTLITRFGRRRAEHPAQLATVLLDTDAMRLTLVWQSALAVSSRDVDALDFTTIEVDRG